MRRRRFSAIRPCFPICTMRVTSQMIPKVTCRPWVPTRVKNDDKKALQMLERSLDANKDYGPAKELLAKLKK